MCFMEVQAAEREGAGQISQKIPFIRREAGSRLKGTYTTREAALPTSSGRFARR
jgi:hypothetical protein